MKKLFILLASLLAVSVCADAQETTDVNNGLFRAVKQLSSPQGKTALTALFDSGAAADNLYSELKYSSDKNTDWSRVRYVDGISKGHASALILQLPAGSRYKYVVIYTKSRNVGAGCRIVKSSANWSNSNSIDSRALAAIRRSVENIEREW